MTISGEQGICLFEFSFGELNAMALREQMGNTTPTLERQNIERCETLPLASGPLHDGLSGVQLYVVQFPDRSLFSDSSCCRSAVFAARSLLVEHHVYSTPSSII